MATATVTLTPDATLFPEGTTVEVYAASEFPEGPFPASPPGDPIASAEILSGQVAFVLEVDEYYGASLINGSWRFFAFSATGPLTENTLDGVVEDIAEINARLEVITNRTANPLSFDAYGDGDTDDWHDDHSSVNAAMAWLDNNYGGGTLLVTAPHAWTGGPDTADAVLPRSNITIRFEGGGKFIRRGAFPKAITSRFIHRGNLTNFEVHGLNVVGNRVEIDFVGGLLKGQVVFDDATAPLPVGHPNAGEPSAHTDGEDPGVILVDGVVGDFGIPIETGVFGVMNIEGDDGHAYVTRYETATDLGGGEWQFEGCYGGVDSTFGPDNGVVEEHSGQMRMPLFNLTGVNEHFWLCGGRMDDFPGQLLNCSGHTGDVLIDGVTAVGNRGTVLRRDCTNVRLLNSDLTATDDVIAALALDGVAPPSDWLLDGLVLRSVASEAVDLNPEPEHAGRGFIAQGLHDFTVGTVVHYGAGSDEFSDNRGSLVICSSEAWHPVNGTIKDWISHNPAGAGLLLATIQGHPCSAENIRASVEVNGARGDGITLRFDPTSAPKDISVADSRLVDCGSASDAGAGILLSAPDGGVTIDGFDASRTRIVRPEGRAIWVPNQFDAINDGFFDDITIEDPNQSESAIDAAVLLNDIQGGSVRGGSITRGQGVGVSTDGWKINATCDEIVVADLHADPDTFTGEAVVDTSGTPRDPHPELAIYRRLEAGTARLTTAATTNVTYACGTNIATPIANVSADMVSASPFALEGAVLDIARQAPLMRLVVVCLTGGAPSVTVTAGLHSVQQAAGSATWTLVPGTTVVVTPAANEDGVHYSDPFALPLDERYAFGVTRDVTPSASVVLSMRLELLMGE